MKILNLLLLIECVSNSTKVDRTNASSVDIDVKRIRYSIPSDAIPKIFFAKDNSSEEDWSSYTNIIQYSNFKKTVNNYNLRFIDKNNTATKPLNNRMQKLSDFTENDYSRDIFIFLMDNKSKNSINYFINEKNIKNVILLEGATKNIDQIKTTELKNLLWDVWRELLLSFQENAPKYRGN
jgi:hypothetical protein